MLKKLITISTLMAASTCYSVTIEQAIESAYQHNNDYKKSIEAFKESIEAFPQALGAFLPSVNASIGYSNDDTYSLDDDKKDQKTNSTKKLTKSLELRQNIFNGGESTAALKIAKYGFIIAKSKFDFDERKFLLDAVKTYLDAVEVRDNLKIQQESLSFFAKTVSSTKNKFSVGQATRTDIAQAEAAYAKAQSDEAALTAKKVQADMLFKQCFGLDAKDLKWPEAWQDIGKSFEEFKKIITMTSPELRMARAQAAAAKAGVEKAVGSLLPSINLVAGISDSEVPEKALLQNPNLKSRDFTTTIRMDIPIFENGGTEYAKLRQQKAKSRNAAWALDEAKKDVETLVHFEWERFFATKKQYKGTKDQVNAYKMLLESIRKEEVFGNKSVLDVLEAKKELSRAETENLSARKSYLTVSYNARSLIGEFNAKKLKLNVKTFDADKEFKKVQFKLIGF
jgi:outer membrane protein